MPGAFTVTREETAFGTSEFVEATATLGPLGASIIRSVGYAERFPAVVTRREVPRGTVTLMLGFADDLGVDMPDGSHHSVTGFLAGVHDRPAIVHTVGDSAAVQLELSPLAAHRAFGVSLTELTNHLVPLDDMMGRDAALLLEQLAETSSWNVRLHLAHDFVSNRLADAAPTPAEVAEAYRQLVDNNGAVTVSDLAASVGWSRRHLTNRFAEHIGLPPKGLARVLRFHNAVRMLSAGLGAPLVDVAVAAGYYDQAHFNREFREIAGCTPTEFQRAQLPGNVGVLADGQASTAVATMPSN